MNNANTLSTPKRRIVWIDVAKTITIIAMVIGHSLPYGSTGRNFIFSFHMPLFFILTGYTLRSAESWSSLRKIVQKDCLRLLLPGVLTQSVNCLLRIIIGGGIISQELTFLLRQLFWASAVDYQGQPALGALWFLVVMFWAKLYYQIVRLLFPSKYNFMIYLLAAAFAKMVSSHIWLPQSFDLVPVAALFLLVGAALRKCEKCWETYEIPLSVCCFVFWIFQLQRGIYIEIGTRSYPEFILCILEAVCGSICIFTLSKAFEEEKRYTSLLQKIGQHTLLILCVHHLDTWLYSFWYRDSGVLTYFLRLLTVFLLSGIILLLKQLWNNFFTKKHTP